MKCFYHSDLDGHAAAFCVFGWVGIKPNPDKGFLAGEFIEINYGTPFPLNKILPGEQVWIVDYSIEPAEMMKLLEITQDVTWIDHHKTAIEKYKDFPHNIRGIRKDGEAACVLTWKYIHWWTDRGEGPEDFNALPSNAVPRCILLTGDRDVWAWNYGEETKFFFSGSQIYNTRYDSEFWWRCMDVEYADTPSIKIAKEKGILFWVKLLEAGRIVEAYKKSSDEGVNLQLGYETTFEGYKCWAINRGRISSDRLGGRIKEYDILLPFYFDGNQWTVSLYSEKVDVSAIAKKYGGGGHKGASGFQAKELPFKRNSENP